MKTRKWLAMVALVLMLRVHWGKDKTGIMVAALGTTVVGQAVVRLDDGKLDTISLTDITASEWEDVQVGK